MDKLDYINIKDTNIPVKFNNTKKCKIFYKVLTKKEYLYELDGYELISKYYKVPKKLFSFTFKNKGFVGYSYVERPIYVQCLNTNKIDDILAWLNGKGEFEYKGRKTTARFYNQLEPIRTASLRIIDTTFMRDPFWYKAEDEYVVVTDSVTNEGNIQSRPIIRLEKNVGEEIDITIGGIRFVYNFGEDTYVEIDCEEKTVTYEGLNRNRQIEINYEFPILQEGTNTITVNSGDATIKVKIGKKKYSKPHKFK